MIKLVHREKKVKRLKNNSPRPRGLCRNMNEEGGNKKSDTQV